ncbi:hypothetical protein FRACYDRAFT_216380 [Fragilariopsis cylindrus CCMP1102]|uniref:DOMON domain-containing protein n=1 Tax=Fragilariopsis cylindrus CCMP1102 TaxID=635003 RepID=A0A1E7FZF8_9STRA|nr:hypothetical protein FRACYDRAFT_216380 [Fragilariopsis cylindrus CCMP1102]|eukprot:OEU23530.1 hypothetical protein FRACYDRAFT_216380 [Fragilariopsis cylindrus CCMP1102]
MKLSLTFLALAVATVQADLTTKWNIEFGTATQVGSVYTFTYDDIGTEMALSNMKSSVTLGDCTGAAFASNDAGTAAITSPVDAMTMTFAASTDDTGMATVVVDMQTKIAAAQGALWTAVGPDGGGTLKYCVRYGLFAAGDNEVNFSETVVTLTITMEGGFEVPSFEVAEKAKTESTQAQEYTVSAALCSTGDGTDGAFLQGSLICVKVSPSSPDVEVTSISEFTWTNESTENTEDITTQAALPIAGGDGLSSYAGTDEFSTILYAQFYESGIPVKGAGTANLGFTTARRLGASGSENNGRVLQEVDAVQEFEIVADIVRSDDSPSALQTAGGATASFVVTIVGLVGAVLLA